MKTFSEYVLLAYLSHLAENHATNTLWSQYSMLRSTLIIHRDIDISKFAKLKAYLKRQSDGYLSKKSNVSTPDNINRFPKEASDDTHLLQKVCKFYIFRKFINTVDSASLIAVSE